MQYVYKGKGVPREGTTKIRIKLNKELTQEEIEKIERYTIGRKNEFTSKKVYVQDGTRTSPGTGNRWGVTRYGHYENRGEMFECIYSCKIQKIEGEKEELTYRE